MPLVFDGHNDVLTRLLRGGGLPCRVMTPLTM